MSLALITLPKKIAKNDIVEVKLLLSHIMETGYRRDVSGAVIARDIVKFVKAKFNDVLVFEAQLSPAIAANPFLAFFMVVPTTGLLKIEWGDEKGGLWHESVDIAV